MSDPLLLAQLPVAPAIWAMLGVLAALGLLAVGSPSRFQALTTRSSRWVDTEKVLAALDKRVDIDHYVLPYSRCLGVALLAAVGILAYVLWSYLQLG